MRGMRFDLALFADFRQQAGHLRAANFLVSHFAPTMKNHGANFVAFTEEAENLALANLKIVLRSRRAKLYFFQLRTAAALALLVSLLVLPGKDTCRSP